MSKRCDPKIPGKIGGCQGVKRVKKKWPGMHISEGNNISQLIFQLTKSAVAKWENTKKKKSY